VGAISGCAASVVIYSGFCAEDDISRLGRFLLIVYFVETGLVLGFAPWSELWERNLFIETIPILGEMARSPAVLGAVSGVGLVTLCAGLWELAVLVRLALSRQRPLSGVGSSIQVSVSRVGRSLEQGPRKTGREWIGKS